MAEEIGAAIQAEDVDAEALRLYVNASSNDNAYVTSCLSEATALVDGYIGTAEVPAAILGRAYLEAGSELFHRRQAPNGIAQFATADGAPTVRVARDPLVGVYPLVARYVGGGFA